LARLNNPYDTDCAIEEKGLNIHVEDKSRIYTRGIVLEEITTVQFNKYKYRRHGKGWKNNGVCCEIKKTIVGKDYKSFITFLLRHPYAQQVCVRVGEGWDKEYKDKIIDSKGDVINNDRLEEMAKKASDNEIKDNYFEIKLKGPNEKFKDPKTIIELSEFNYKGKRYIAVVKVGIPQNHHKLFSIKYNKSHFEHGNPYMVFGIVGDRNNEWFARQSRRYRK